MRPPTNDMAAEPREPRPTLEEFWMAVAVENASRSNCCKLHVGAVILREDLFRASGFNGTIRKYPNCYDGGCPRCCDENFESGMGLDLCICVHAEENALMSAARDGVSVAGATCYVTHEPCLSCTKLLIQAGIVEVVYLKEYDYPNLPEHRRNRAQMRNYVKDHGIMQFRQLSINDLAQSADLWLARLDDMKAKAWEYAKQKGVIRPKKLLTHCPQCGSALQKAEGP